MSRCWALAAVIVALLTCARAFTQIYAENIPPDDPAIDYQNAPLNNPVSRLAAELAAGSTTLAYREGGLAFLPGLLERLDVPADSQALPFAKASFQATRISPRNPRAVYFSDTVAIGFVRGSESLELAALDPAQGTVFYTLDVSPDRKPVLTRGQVCLRCHQGPATMGVPGMFVGSVFPNALGVPAREGAIITDHRTPFGDRWGGWFVDSAHGEQPDRANSVAPDPADPEALEPVPVRFKPSGYLSPTSDIVALMTLEHQTQMGNLLTRINWETRTADHRQLEADLIATLRYMFFVDEARFSESIAGVSSFTRTFPQRGPRDQKGRSLRDFDLSTRLFRYPLSYMIYSPAFDALPPATLARVYRLMFDVLSGHPPSGFPPLTATDRRAVYEIVSATKNNLPGYWRAPFPG